ncbi:MAG: polyhydroxyalkanoate depolymerase [Pseudomonadota bacterium]
MLYHWYEISHAALGPARAAADSCRLFLKNPFNPLSHTTIGKSAAAACEVFERTTRRYGKPFFEIFETKVNHNVVPVYEEVVWEKPFCRLIRFRRDFSTCPELEKRHKSRVLLVAPMSGHYATLLRGTVRDLLPMHDVYITDWIDARMVPSKEGQFDLSSYIDYIVELMELFQGDVHVIGVCQPSVPIISAVTSMEIEQNPFVPHSMILMGGPIDTRINQTAVNTLAEAKGIEWFERNVITNVPWPSPGHGRKVYPGFLQLTGFMTMNLDRHVSAHKDLFWHLVQGDGDSADKHRDFYDEYLAVMDLTAEFYLQTVETVFISHDLPKGRMTYRNQIIDLSKIKRVALMTIEGEKDDISGVGQCAAAQDLCTGLPATKKHHYEQPGVGHYGIFNGSRFRSEIAPRMTDFIKTHHSKSKPAGPELKPIETIDYTKNVTKIDGSELKKYN